MIYIHRFDEVLVESDSSQWENDNYKIYWEGFVFITGVLSGEDSIRVFSKEIEDKGIKKASGLLRGGFACVVFDKKTKIYYSFVDNSRQYCLFYTDRAISTSFLELVHRQEIKSEALDPECAVEFILTGLVFSEKIFFEGVNVIEADKVLSLSDSKLIIQKKDTKDPFSLSLPPTTSAHFLKAFEDIVPSLKNKNISIDLTGGTDSRTITVILNHFGMEFETAVCGENGHSDLYLSKKIARILGFDHHITYHSVKNDNIAKDLNNTFRAYDGLSDILTNNRLYQLQKQRKKRNIDLVIGGSGGELYKDGGYWRGALGTKNKEATITN